jgi:hypothetical protein
MDTLNLEFGFEFDVETRWQHVFAAEAARAGSGGERRGRKGVGSIATAQLSQLISRHGLDVYIQRRFCKEANSSKTSTQCILY